MGVKDDCVPSRAVLGSETGGCGRGGGWKLRLLRTRSWEEERRLTILPQVLRIHALAHGSLIESDKSPAEVVESRSRVVGLVWAMIRDGRSGEGVVPESET